MKIEYDPTSQLWQVINPDFDLGDHRRILAEFFDRGKALDFVRDA